MLPSRSGKELTPVGRFVPEFGVFVAMWLSFPLFHCKMDLPVIQEAMKDFEPCRGKQSDACSEAMLQTTGMSGKDAISARTVDCTKLEKVDLW